MPWSSWHEARPLFVAIDDVPWLDQSSTELLGTILSALPDSPILVAATYRDDEPTPPAVNGLLDQVRRAGGVEIPLGPLALRDIEPLIVCHLGGETVNPELARVVFERSLGNPLFCLELMRTSRDHGVIRLLDGRWSIDSGGLSSELPETIRTLVASRCAALPERARELLATAAELGPEFSYDTLLAVAAASDRKLLEVLDTALASGLLIEIGRGYAFAHPLYRVAVRGTLSRRRRGEACLAIACALAGVDLAGATPEELARVASECPGPAAVAEHALSAVELGVQAAIPLAVAFGFAAGALEKRVFDRDGATALLDRALEAWRRLPAASAIHYDASEAYALVADLRMKAGEDTAATRSFHEAIATARTADEVARAYVASFWLPYRHGDFEAALAILEEGLAVLPEDAAAARARVQTAIGWCLVRLRRLDDALISLEEAHHRAPGIRGPPGLDAGAGLPGSPPALPRPARRGHRPPRTVARCSRASSADSDGEMRAQIHLAAGPDAVRSSRAGTQPRGPFARARVAQRETGTPRRSPRGEPPRCRTSWATAARPWPIVTGSCASWLPSAATRTTRRSPTPTSRTSPASRATRPGLPVSRRPRWRWPARPDDTDYPARIRAALGAESWSRLES